MKTIKNNDVKNIDVVLLDWVISECGFDTWTKRKILCRNVMHKSEKYIYDVIKRKRAKENTIRTIIDALYKETGDASVYPISKYYIQEDIDQDPAVLDYCANDIEATKDFLTTQQNYINDLLNKNGHLLLNEAYSSLGLPHPSEGADMEWVKGDKEVFEKNFMNPPEEPEQTYGNSMEESLRSIADSLVQIDHTLYLIKKHMLDNDRKQKVQYKKSKRYGTGAAKRNPYGNAIHYDGYME